MIGTFTYCITRLRFLARCEGCGAEVGDGTTPYYFSAPRGQTPRHRCYRCRHGKPGEGTSRKTATAPPVVGTKWTDGQPVMRRRGGLMTPPLLVTADSPLAAFSGGEILTAACRIAEQRGRFVVGPNAEGGRAFSDLGEFTDALLSELREPSA